MMAEFALLGDVEVLGDPKRRHPLTASVLFAGSESQELSQASPRGSPSLSSQVRRSRTRGRPKTSFSFTRPNDLIENILWQNPSIRESLDAQRSLVSAAWTAGRVPCWH